MGNQKLYKGSLQTIILKLLESNDKMYGYEITQKVKELTKGELKITEEPTSKNQKATSL